MKEAKLSYWAHHLTTVVSVTLVLLLVGIIAAIWIAADAETRRLREQIELSVVLSDSVPSAAAADISERLKQQPYAANVTVISRQQALESWKNDTGEDLQEIFGVNPFSEEVTFTVKADYAASDKIKGIVSRIEMWPGVEEVSSPDTEMVDAMNQNIGALTVILAIIAAVMLVISFVLINNTVHLTVYSRRFTIHTMQLVGATNGFIRRPILIDNLLAGLLAGLIASAVMAVAIVAARDSAMPDIADFFGWGAYGIVAGSLVIVGMLLCVVASLFSANLYLKKDYDSLFH